MSKPSRRLQREALKVQRRKKNSKRKRFETGR
jgi:hypothetical protein